MIYKLGNDKDMDALPPLDGKTEEIIYVYTSTLTYQYGEERNVDEDDGGVVFYVPPGTDREELKVSGILMDQLITRRSWVSDEAKPRCGFARNGGAKAGGFLSQTRLAQKTTRDATGPFKSHLRNHKKALMRKHQGSFLPFLRSPVDRFRRF